MMNDQIAIKNTSLSNSLNSSKEFLQNLIDSGQLPSYIKKVETAYIIAEYGKELGFKPITSFNYIISIQGKLTISAKGQQAILRKHKVKWKTVEDFVYLYADGSVSEFKIDKKDENGNSIPLLDIRTTIIMYRGDEEEKFSFYWTEAVKAGLVEKDVWKKYPKSMMWARTFTTLANRVASDLILGFYSTEEILDTIDDSNIQEDMIIRNSKGEVISYVEKEDLEVVTTLE